MRYALSLYWVFILIIGLILPAHASERLFFLVENDCPYSCDQQDEGAAGFVQDILVTIFSRNGYDVHFVVMPWSRILSTFNMGEDVDVTGIIGMRGHGLNKTKALFPKMEIAQYSHAFYATENNTKISEWEYSGVNSLHELRIAAVQDWSYCDEALTEYIKGGQLPTVQKMTGLFPSERNLKKLMLGRVDLWLSNQFVADYLIKKKIQDGDLNEGQIVKLQKIPINTDVSVYPIFINNGKGRRLANIFDDGMKLLRESGELNVILDKYGVSDWVN